MKRIYNGTGNTIVIIDGDDVIFDGKWRLKNESKVSVAKLIPPDKELARVIYDSKIEDKEGVTIYRTTHLFDDLPLGYYMYIVTEDYAISYRMKEGKDDVKLYVPHIPVVDEDDYIIGYLGLLEL